MRLCSYSDRCSGCKVCVLTCALSNHGLNNPKLGSVSILPRFPEPGLFELGVCTKCGACRDACPVGAIQEQANGFYRVDPSLCVGCGVCIEECPQKVIRMIPESNVAFTCVGCGECVKYCPKEAIVDLDGEVKRV